MFNDLEHSYPAIGGTALTQDQRALLSSLPADYRSFLKRHNGGFVPEFRYCFLTGVPFQTETVNNPSRDDCVVELYGLRTIEPNGRWPTDLMEAAKQHHADNLLPADVIAIASCSQNSLVCMSLKQVGCGTIYYWEYYWQYPWCSGFFEPRIKEACARFERPQAIAEDPHHPDHRALLDAMNFAKLVQLADSFTDWCESCFDGTAGT